MTASVTQTTTEVGLSGVVSKTSVVWVAAANGTVTGNVSLGHGSVVSVEFIPAGSPAPTGVYAVTLKDANGINLLDDGTGTNLGAALSATVPTRKAPFVGGATSTFVRMWAEGGTYNLSETGAGNGASGTVNVFQVPGVL